ncbi:MAG: hypothetical protein GY913_30425 [Proteobacteria bacterium]|nr:hypothetical protein [Pseudomonadota bacterium]MCP4921233.1 hypothetical protein [Pseudomonadota bacterium]
MKRPPYLLLVALALYALLAAATVNGIGVVGEVAATWGLPVPPNVLVDFDGPAPGVKDDGLLRSSHVRPMERIQLGDVAIPLAVNQYTGGPPDWPARMVHAATGSRTAVTATHIALGALLLVLVHRFLRFHGSPGSAGLAALVLAADWSFVFFRKVLGGTEILLQASALLVLWAFWSRRWAGGRLGSLAIAVGIGLGLLAKATFAVTLVAFAIAALATRWDKPALKPPPPLPLWKMGLTVLALVSPLLITLVDHIGLEPTVPSHDLLSLQFERLGQGLERLVSGDAMPERESNASMSWFLTNPLPWVATAWRGEAPTGPSILRLIGWGVVLGGSFLAWARRRSERSDALLRFVSVFVPLQLLGLWLANRDLHHLAQASPLVAIWFALAANRLIALRFNVRSRGRAWIGLALALPWVLSGANHLRQTDTVVETLSVRHFTEQGQASLDWLLADVDRLVVCDYDLYGMLELRNPHVRVTNGWAVNARRFSERDQVLVQLLEYGSGGHYLQVRPSAPMIYNNNPSDAALLEAAELAGVTLVEVGALEDADGAWARLYSLQPKR